MKIAILGTGMVGQTLAAALASKGHSVVIGTRNVAAALATHEVNAFGMPAFGTWHQQNKDIEVATFADAARHSDLIINATHGAASIEILHQANACTLGQKVLLNVANDLDFSKGMPPSLAVIDQAGAGLAERIAKAFPNLRVVKSLSTMNAFIMVNPALVAGGDSTVFLSGDDAQAKSLVKELLQAFGWKDILDLGGLSTSRAVEQMLPAWLNLFGVIGMTPFNFKIVR